MCVCVCVCVCEKEKGCSSVTESKCMAEEQKNKEWVRNRERDWKKGLHFEMEKETKRRMCGFQQYHTSEPLEYDEYFSLRE